MKFTFALSEPRKISSYFKEQIGFCKVNVFQANQAMRLKFFKLFYKSNHFAEKQVFVSYLFQPYNFETFILFLRSYSSKANFENFQIIAKSQSIGKKIVFFSSYLGYETLK